MRIKHLKFQEHPVLGDLEIDFADENEEPLEIVAFIGDNGTGKTQVLESIVELTKEKFKVPLFAGTYMQASNEVATLTIGNTKLVEVFVNRFREVQEKGNSTYKLVWMPADLNANIQYSENRELDSSEWVEYAESWHLDDINDYIVNKINRAARRVFIEGLSQDTYEREIEDINETFSKMSLNVRFTGLSDEDNPVPVFRNSKGDEFEIANLSSGEKQLFFRMLNLKRLNINNAIIVIDEPETSLHPEWQRKIIEVYKNIGENNQIILATHSPLIIGSIPNEGIRVMRRDDDGKIQVEYGYQTYGKSAEYILREMGLEHLRNEETEEKLEELRNLLRADNYDTSRYDELLTELKNQLDSIDPDIMLIEMEEIRRKRKHEKN